MSEERLGQPRQAGQQIAQTRPEVGADDVGGNDEVVRTRTLYVTPASRRKNNGEDLINQFIDTIDENEDGAVEREMLQQVTNSGKKRTPSDPGPPAARWGYK